MKIALVIPYNPLEEIGGLELGTMRLATSLQQLGHAPVVITKGQSGTFQNIEVKGYASFAELCRHLISYQAYDIVHWLEIFPDKGEVELQGMTSCLLRSCGTKVVMMVATSGNLRTRGQGLLTTSLLQKAADYYIVSNPDQIQEFEASGITDNVSIIGFGVDTTSTFFPLDNVQKSSMRTTLGLPNDKILCLFVGRFVERKRPDFLLKCWQTLSCIHDQAELVVVGSGMGQHDSIEESLTTLAVATPKSHFRDITINPEKYYQACDVLLLPSSREGQPNVLMEMMSCGNPVIGSDIAGIRELLIHGRTGLMFPLNDRDAFRSAVVNLVNDGDYRKLLGQAAREKIVSEKDVSQVAKQYVELYEQPQRR
jgi:glycosyltransferase involved in cell wall biosynthesis